MVSLSDLLENLKGLLDKFYVRKNLNYKSSNDEKYPVNGVVVTDDNREITVIQSLSANSTMISGLSSVATSGSYNSLSNKPTKLTDFSSEGFTIDYSSINNRPTKLSEFTNDISIGWSNVTGRPTKLSDFTNDISIGWSNVTGKPTKLSDFTNDISISWGNVTGKPTIDTTPTSSNSNLITSKAVYDGLNNKVDKSYRSIELEVDTPGLIQNDSVRVDVHVKDFNGNQLPSVNVILETSNGKFEGGVSQKTFTTDANGNINAVMISSLDFGLGVVTASILGYTASTTKDYFMIRGSKKIVNASFYQVFESMDFYLVMVESTVTDFESTNTWRTHKNIPSPYRPTYTVPLHIGLDNVSARACVNSEGEIQVIKHGTGKYSFTYSGRYLVRKF